jgi:proteasome lid subunit RPN8/RPN11
MNTGLDNIYKEIAQYCKKNNSYETGGYVKKDNSIIFEDSLFPSPDFYLPSESFYLNIINKKQDILFCFHSHLVKSFVSESDLKFIKMYNIPSLIYIIKDNTFLSVNTDYEKCYFSWNIKGFWEEAKKSKSQNLG